MKDEPVPLTGKSHKERFYELGSKLMTVPKDEIERREKQWKKARARRRRSK